MSERAAQVLRADEADAIDRAVAALRAGQVVACPTETAYALAADALSPAAVQRVAQIKGGAEQHLFSLLVADERMLGSVAPAVPAAARRLMARHWPGPLTLVLPAAPDLPEEMVNDIGGVGVRISSDPVAQALVRRFGGPITATSANRSGDAPAREAAAASLRGVAVVLDGGPRQAQVSTVAQVDQDGNVAVLRHGPVRLDAR